MAKKIDLRGWALTTISRGNAKKAKEKVAKMNKENKEYEYIAVKQESNSQEGEHYYIYSRLAKPFYVTSI
jgi:hypothetical protein